MATQFTSEDLELLGYVSAEEVATPGAQGFTRFRAIAQAGLEQIEFHFIYIKADCSAEQLAIASSHALPGTTTYVVHPRSLKLVRSTLDRTFGKRARIHEVEDLIWGRLNQLFTEYLTELRKNIAADPHYIAPRQEGAEPHERLDQVLVNYLRGEGFASPGELAVVCAPAAVGKTTLSRKIVVDLVSSLERYKIIPVYVESSHWQRLRLESVDDLWDIISNSIGAFAPVPLLNQRLFNYALKQGYLCFIFDGFDELCSHRSGKFNADQVLADLAGISAASNARIILTTRTLYWETAVHNHPQNTKPLQLAPFNRQQALGYLSQYFSKDSSKRDKAHTLYDGLGQHSRRPTQSGGARAQFVSLPICVVMIAQYVEHGGTAPVPETPGQFLKTVLLTVCERERARKQLVTSAAEQLAAFEAVAIEVCSSTNPSFDTSLLEAAGLREEDGPKLVDHFLLGRSREMEGAYQFAFDFVAPYLRAVSIEAFISEDSTVLEKDLWRVMSQESNGRGFMLEQLVSLLQPRSIPEVKKACLNIPSTEKQARSFLMHVARALIEEDTNVKTIGERTQTYLEFLSAERDAGAWVLSQLFFNGAMERLDLTGVEFRHCTFQDVSFVGSIADHTTRFDRCTFVGEVTFPSPYAGWVNSHLSSCSLLSPANLAWEAVVRSDMIDGDHNLHDALKLALDRFWHHGRLKGSISRNDWGKGLLGQTRYCRLLLEAMLRHGLVYEIVISGVSEGGYGFDRDSIWALQKFMDNRQHVGKIKLVFDDVSRAIQ
ncbi:MAG: NACHT domain-containing protein [Burkholderiales bacterium]